MCDDHHVMLQLLKDICANMMNTMPLLNDVIRKLFRLLRVFPG